jgi:hypothetical protein
MATVTGHLLLNNKDYLQAGRTAPGRGADAWISARSARTAIHVIVHFP